MMVDLIKPRLGETIYDPACGIGSLLLEAKKYIERNSKLSAVQQQQLNNNTFYGRELDLQIFRHAQEGFGREALNSANLWNGNTLLKYTYNQSFPNQFDLILSNPPFSDNATVDEQQNFEIPTRYMELLFLQHIIETTRLGGRCAIVVPEGVLNRTDKQFREVKQKFLSQCDLKEIIQLDKQVAPYTHVKFNVMVFTKGRITRQFIYRTPDKRSQSISIETIETNNYDLTPPNDTPYVNEAETIPEIALKAEGYKIFISYRRDDTGWPTGWLHDFLEQRLGAKVFYDRTSINPGQKFNSSIEEALNQCNVLIAMIGKNWLTDRLNSPEDWVRREIAQAIKQQMMIIPVLVDNVSMPSKEQLPDEISDLTFSAAIEDFKPTNFQQAAEHLVKIITDNLYTTDHN